MNLPRYFLIFIAIFLVVIAFNIGRDNVAESQPAPKSYDPCNTEFHRSFPISVATAATTFGAAGQTSNSGPITICSISMTVPTSSSCELVACDAGTSCTHQQLVTGAYATGVIQNGGGTNTVATVPDGMDVDYVSTGTGCQGVVSYVRGVGKVVPSVTATPTFTPSPTPT